MKYKAEYVYAVAANMDRGNRVSCEVYHRGHEVLLFNTDRTLISRWSVAEELPGEVRFFAADWEEGCKIDARGESITFSRAASDYEWSKCSRVPAMNFEEVAKIFEEFASRWMPEMPSITLDENILRFLDERLRHTEFKVKGGRFELVQRDIYTGEIKRTQAQGQGGLLVGRPTVETLETRAMRTVDFQSLFLLAKQFDLFFDEHYTYGRTDDGVVEVLIANCLYDEMSDINILTPDPDGGIIVSDEIVDVVKDVAEGKLVLGVDQELRDRTQAEFEALVVSVEGFGLAVESNLIPEHYGLGLSDYQADWNAFYIGRHGELTGDDEEIQAQIAREYPVIWSLFGVRDRLLEQLKPETSTTSASQPTTGQVSTPSAEEAPQRLERRQRHGRQKPEGAEGEPQPDQPIESSEGSDADSGDGPEAAPVRRRRG